MLKVFMKMAKLSAPSFGIAGDEVFVLSLPATFPDLASRLPMATPMQ